MKHYRLIHLFSLPALIAGLLIISVNQNAGAALSIAGMTAFLSSFAATLRNRPEENWVKERKRLARIIGCLAIGGSLLSLGYVITVLTGDNPILLRVKVLGMLVLLSGVGALVLSLAVANRHRRKDHPPDFSGIPGLPTLKKSNWKGWTILLNFLPVGPNMHVSNATLQYYERVCALFLRCDFTLLRGAQSIS